MALGDMRLQPGTKASGGGGMRGSVKASQGEVVATGTEPKRERLALSIDDAARVLSLSRDSFERHVMAQIRVVRVGRRLLVPVRELERWIDRSSSTPLVAELSRRAGGSTSRAGHRAL